MSCSGYSPNWFLPSVPLDAHITNKIIPPIKGIIDMKTHHPDLSKSWNLLTVTVNPGIIKINKNKIKNISPVSPPISAGVK